MEGLLSEAPSFDQMMSVLGADYPWLCELENTPQDAIWHAEGDVAIHTDMVLKHVYKLISDNAQWSDHFKRSLILGAFFHDIGKTKATKDVYKDNRWCIGAPRHEKMGFDYLSKSINQDMRFNDCASEILQVVGYHNIPKKAIVNDMSYWQLLEYRYKFNPQLLYHFSMCDFKGRHSADKEDQLEYVELFKEQMKEYELWEETFVDPMWEALKNHDTLTRMFLYQKGMADLKEGVIITPEEVFSRYYNELHHGFGELHIMCGVSGSGKTKWVNQYQWDRIISLDEIRKELSKNVLSRKYEGQVMQEAKKRIKEGLANKEKICYDATNLRKDFRDKLIKLADDYRAFYKIHFLQRPLKECIKADGERAIPVGEKIIKEQLSKLENPFF